MSELVLGVLAVSGLGAFLALLLEIADTYIADYGEQHIFVNGERDLVVQGGKPLLFALGEHGIYLPSACGGKGTCAYCKARVLEGGGPVLPTETPYLSSQDLENHIRITCQVKVKETVRVEVPDELLNIRQYHVRVLALENLTPHIRLVRLQMPAASEGFRFKPGQYVQLEVPKYKSTIGPEFRAYSIASASHEPEVLDLVIGRVEGGAVSTYVHDYLKTGDVVNIRGPFGDFWLRDSERPVLLIATGTGLAPLRSMLFQIERDRIARSVTLFFGARTRDDLFFFEELREVEKRLPNFHFVPTLSRPAQGDAWEGEVGRVTRLIDEQIPEGAQMDVYICGAPEMVQSCMELLEKKGVPSDRILFDMFA